LSTLTLLAARELYAPRAAQPLGIRARYQHAQLRTRSQVRAAARAHIERQLAAAVEQLRAPSKTRDMGRFVEVRFAGADRFT
jgi:hypothetical protein